MSTNFDEIIATKEIELLQLYREQIQNVRQSSEIMKSLSETINDLNLLFDRINSISN